MSVTIQGNTSTVISNNSAPEGTEPPRVSWRVFYL